MEKTLKHTRQQKPKSALDLEWDNFTQPRQPARPSEAVNQRTQLFLHSKQEKLEKLTEQQRERELEGCTFAPAVNSAPRKSPRSLKKFLKEQNEFLSRKEEKIKTMAAQLSSLQELEVSAAPFKPALCKKSIDICRKIPQDKTVYDKLFSKSKLDTEAPEFSPFVPKINQKSREIVRSESIGQHLHNDSIRRQNVKPQAQPVGGISASSGSQRLLIEKLAREIDSGFEGLDADEEGALTYVKYSVFMGRVNFLSEDPTELDKNLLADSWKLLTTENTVTKEPLILFLLCVMNLYAGLTTEPPPFTVSSKGIHRKYYNFYSNKVRRNKPVLHSPDPCTFKPETLRTSAVSRESSDLYGLHRQKILQERAELKKQNEEAAVRDCTFHPKINSFPKKRVGVEDYKGASLAQEWKKPTESAPENRNIGLYNLARSRQELSPPPSSEAVKLELDLTECTFNPNSGRTSHTGAIHSTVERLSKPKHQKPRVNYLSCYPDYISPRQVAKQMKSPAEPPEKQFSPNDDVVRITLDLPQGGSDDLIICPEDDKKQKIETFIDKHALTGEIAYQLRTDVLVSLEDL